MSNDNYAPPAAPQQPEKNDKNVKVIAGACFAAAVLLLGIIIGGSGGNDSAPATTAKAAEPVETTDAPVVVDTSTKYDRYYEAVLNNSGRANSESKSKVIEIGDLVCQSLDEGNSMRAIANVLEGASSSQSDLEYAAAVMYWSITYLCPEYKAELDAYVNN